MAKSVLVIEPNLTLRSLWESVLRDAGFYVRGATDGLSGLTALQVEPANLVVVDVALPDMDGYRFCGAVRKLSGSTKIPVLVLTDDNPLVAQTKARTSGAQEVLRLPQHNRDVNKFIADLPVICLRLLGVTTPGGAA